MEGNQKLLYFLLVWKHKGMLSAKTVRSSYKCWQKEAEHYTHLSNLLLADTTVPVLTWRLALIFLRKADGPEGPLLLHLFFLLLLLAVLFLLFLTRYRSLCLRRLSCSLYLSVRYLLWPILNHFLLQEIHVPSLAPQVVPTSSWQLCASQPSCSHEKLKDSPYITYKSSATISPDRLLTRHKLINSETILPAGIPLLTSCSNKDSWLNKHHLTVVGNHLANHSTC